MSNEKILHWPGTGMYQTTVVGTSHCRDAIQSIAQNPQGNAAFVLLTLALVAEPTNVYDSNAVCVQYAGTHVGYLSRADAIRYQGTLAGAPVPFGVCTVDAVITGGLATKHRFYEYSIELDASLDLPPDDANPEFPEPVRINKHLPLRPQSDGTFLVQAWIPFKSHDEISRDRAVHAYRGKNWDVVCIFMENRQNIGYGEKVYEFPLAQCLELFGTDRPDVTVASLRGRVVTLRLRSPT